MAGYVPISKRCTNRYRYRDGYAEDNVDKAERILEELTLLNPDRTDAVRVTKDL